MPKIPTVIKKELTFKKSELDKKCSDCYQPLPHCICFKALSSPEIKKVENDRITFSFKEDWDSEAIKTLYSNIMKTRHG